jgi:ankyrin repeat protein
MHGYHAKCSFKLFTFYNDNFPFRALEDCLKRFPQLVNQKNDDGLTLLHLAALNNHKDIAIFLLKQVLLPYNYL